MFEVIFVLSVAENKSNLDVASKRLFLRWRLSLPNVQHGEYLSDFAHKHKRMWEILRGEPKSQSSRRISYTNALAFPNKQ
jgi:hypothetical protein